MVLWFNVREYPKSSTGSDSGLKRLGSGPRFKVSSDRLVEPGIELGTLGTRRATYHYTISFGHVKETSLNPVHLKFISVKEYFEISKFVFSGFDCIRHLNIFTGYHR